MARGAFWNTFIFAVQATTLWAMVRQTAPDLADAVARIGRILRLRSSDALCFTEHAYERMRAVNFSSGVCEPLVSWLRVLPLPAVGWSDWGTAERIVASLRHLGKLDACLARLRHERQGDRPLYASALPNVETMTRPGAEDVPQVTHPDAHIEAIKKFMGSNP